MFVKKQNILKKPYLPPRIEFEELEEDERSWLLANSTNTGSSGGLKPGGGDPNPDEEESLDLDFTMDFVVNEGPQL